MASNALNSLLNPVRMNILQLFLENETETVKRIAEELPDLPPASLYRHVNKLVEDEIIEVCAEYKIRGTVEKVYRLKNDPSLHFYAFAMTLLRDFDKYLQNKDYNLVQDRIDFQSYALYLSDQECDELAQTLRETLHKMADTKSGGGERRLRKFSFAVIPGDEKGKKKNNRACY
ncbi:helix-turn-helix domain-containing protein [Desulfitobacterium hafniense]|uniref:helix-turn-helix domain-containing protein n=1 Tax=Desulfitobacterium hafniense TaxID=49338 RepID=UPI0003A7A9C5|nr:helix-turn-helix domain-containing protein [Desulfitobacterium hafniense]